MKKQVSHFLIVLLMLVIAILIIMATRSIPRTNRTTDGKTTKKFPNDSVEISY